MQIMASKNHQQLDNIFFNNLLGLTAKIPSELRITGHLIVPADFMETDEFRASAGMILAEVGWIILYPALDLI